MRRSDDDPFSPPAVRKLLDRLEEKPLPHFTPIEHASLLGLIQTTLEVHALDVTLWATTYLRLVN